MKRRMLSVEENDAYTSWRKYYCYLQRAGAVKQVKKRTHRRERREGKEEIRKGDE